MKNEIINIKWLLFDKAFRMLGGLFIYFALARYLSLEEFGLLNYILAVVGVFGVFVTFGTNVTLVKEVVKNRHDDFEVIKNAIAIRLVIGILSGIMLVFLWVNQLSQNQLFAAIVLSLIVRNNGLKLNWLISMS
jgi:PST family polysaccharide transporter